MPEVVGAACGKAPLLVQLLALAAQVAEVTQERQAGIIPALLELQTLAVVVGVQAETQIYQ
jgi:hypothetical protein